MRGALFGSAGAALVMLAAVVAGPRGGAVAAERPSPQTPSPLPAPGFDQARALTTIDEIASDAFAGRKSGLPSGRAMEEYVARRFRDWRLDPAGEGGTFFQSFPMLATDERGAAMELLDSPYGTVPFVYGEDFALVTNSGSGDVTAEVVIVGHGLSDPVRHRDDYGGVDVHGKIVLIFRGAPEDGYDWDLATSRDSTLHAAVERGAATVLYIQEDRPVHGGAVHEGSYFPEVPVAYVGHRLTDHLFVDEGIERAEYETEIASDVHPLATGKRLRISAGVVRLPDASARNVLGRVRGSDRALRDEIILVGGHMDHLGTDGRGLVFNGANDNGSGTAIVMELARSFAQARSAPRRTIVFASFAGEEQGILGSEALAEKPPFDLGHVVAMINLDMVGHGGGKVAIGGGEQHPDVMRAFRARLVPAEAESMLALHAWGGEGSDYAPFRDAGIPTYNIWSLAEQHFYHRIDDDPKWIDAAAVGHVGLAAERWLRFLADWPEPLARPHQEGRTLLYGSSQVDLDGDAVGALPPYVVARVRWFDGEDFGSQAFMEDLDRLVAEARSESLAVGGGLSSISGAVRTGKRSVLIGLDVGRSEVPARFADLMGDLHVSLARGAKPGSFAAAGVALVASPDTAWIAALPAGGRSYVRIFANREPALSDPGAYPRSRFFFIVSLVGPMPPADLAARLERIGWDRAHLDLVPWILRGGEEPVAAFLEQLVSEPRVEPRHLRAMLGRNLDRM